MIQDTADSWQSQISREVTIQIRPQDDVDMQAALQSARDIAEVVETLREHEAPAIFVGQQASPALQRLAQVVSDEVGRPVAILPILTGTLAPAGEPGDTYLGYLRYNLAQFTLGLAN